MKTNTGVMAMGVRAGIIINVVEATSVGEAAVDAVSPDFGAWCFFIHDGGTMAFG